MPSLHGTLRPLLRFALELYFLEIQVVGRETIPRDGPLILAANHPNSLMDTVLLSTQTPRRIHFLARSGLFSNPLASAFFRRMGAIPVIRAEDHPANRSASDRPTNDATFDAVFHVLESGGCIGIFPEGRNSPDGHVAPFRSGLARMALGAEARNDFSLGTCILPVGLHFERRDRFFTGALLRIGAPIPVAPWRDAWQQDPLAAARELTAQVQEAVRQETLHLEDSRQGALVRALDEILGEKLIDALLVRIDAPSGGLRQRIVDELRNTPYRKRDLDDAFQVRQFLGDLVGALARDRPDDLDELQRRTNAYRDHVGQVRLRHDVLLDAEVRRMSSTRETIRLTAYALCFGPFALWGLAHHVLPAWLVQRAALRAPDEAIRAITVFSVSLLVFPAWYALQAWGLHRSLDVAWPWIAVHVMVLPVAGFFWLRYVRQLIRYRQRILARTLFRSERALLTGLVRERRELLDLVHRLANATGAQLPGEAAALREEASPAH